MKKTIPLLLGCFLCAMPLFADTKLGSVQAFSGDVTIDAFGKGSFLKVITGDALYASTVLRSGPDGRATIEVQGTKQEIPPGALVRITDLVSASAKRNGLGWFAAVGKLIKSFSEASQAKEDDLVLGSRAAEVSEDADKGMEWQGDETDAAAALPTARKYIEDGGYMTALQELSKAAMPSDPRLVFELLFWKGFCYYQVGDYPDAAKNLSDAHTRTQSPGASAGTPEERGSSNWAPRTSFSAGRRTRFPFCASTLQETPTGHTRRTPRSCSPGPCSPLETEAAPGPSRSTR
jgi:hypothetical protein